ncbi:hyalin-like [Patiria miniata]|uniref:HYR domain-containing protein n=1 Tax=Patiria miniata TaxID=46514 RepID=A0A914A5V4_PATMI|nr:hyalin-like [Patiria miniata]
MGAHFIWIVFMVTSGWLRDSQADFCTPSSVSTYDCVFPDGFEKQARFDSCNRTNTCLNPLLPTVATGECNGVTTQICSVVRAPNDPPLKDVCSSSPCKNGGKCISQREGVLCCYCNPATPPDSGQACYDPAIINVSSRTPCAADDGAPPTIDSCNDVRTNKDVVSDIISDLDVTATDNVMNSLPIHCIETSGALHLTSNETTFNCTATDTAGGETTCTFNVFFDQQAPVIDNCPSNVRTNNAVVTWTPDPTATDNDGTTPAVSCIPAAGSSFPVDATTIVVCNAIDAAGNEAICTFNVAVV